MYRAGMNEEELRVLSQGEQVRRSFLFFLKATKRKNRSRHDNPEGTPKLLAGLTAACLVAARRCCSRVSRFTRRWPRAASCC
eukprot:COSAG01_NODE_2353_length_7849_cov_4.770194_6_plen_82_part_00